MKGHVTGRVKNLCTCAYIRTCVCVCVYVYVKERRREDTSCWELPRGDGSVSNVHPWTSVDVTIFRMIRSESFNPLKCLLRSKVPRELFTLPDRSDPSLVTPHRTDRDSSPGRRFPVRRRQTSSGEVSLRPVSDRRNSTVVQREFTHFYFFS